MILRVAGGSLLGAMVLMFWGYAYWAVLLPPGTALRDVHDQPELARALGSLLPRAGTYFIPHMAEHEDDPQSGEHSHAELSEALGGTVAMVHFAPGAGNPLSPLTYLLSTAHFLLSTVLASLLLLVALPVLKTYARRAAFVFGLAVFATIAVRLTDPIWYRLPWAYFLYASLYLIVGWGLTALVMAAVLRPRSRPS